MKIRGKRVHPSVIQRSEPHGRSPYALKFEDGFGAETLKQEQCARRDAWEMAQTFHKLKEKDKATHSEVWCLPAPSSTKPEER